MIALDEEVTIDKNNEDFEYALELIKSGQKLIYITGKAGTGKTTFLKFIRNNIEKKLVVLAPTGMAAINAGGQTLHSFFKIPPSVYIPDDDRLSEKNIKDNFDYWIDKKKIIRSLELLIIDEVSMVRCDLLDVVDQLMKYVRKDATPFGGCQVLLIGDTFQLPPVSNLNEWTILSHYYKSPFFFNSKILEENEPAYIELRKIYRQKEKDFIDLLNKVRVNNLTDSDFKLLKTLTKNEIKDKGPYVTLVTHNLQADTINYEELNALKDDSYEYIASITGDFKESLYPTQETLELKVGAHIMFIKNIPKFFNGQLGIISNLTKDNIYVEVNGEENIVPKSEWRNIRYELNSKKQIITHILGTFVQFPIRLAWAITVHKSQGQTFDRVIADVEDSFAAGQVYVALSRCTSLSGLVLKSEIPASAIQTDNRVIEFAKKATPETLVTQHLNKNKADKLYRQAIDAFKNHKYYEAFTFFQSALKHRDDSQSSLFKRFLKVYSQYHQHNNQKSSLLNENVQRVEHENKILKVQFELSSHNLSKTQEQLGSVDRKSD